MKSIGGNTTALVQVKVDGVKNAIGERIHEWQDVTCMKGWLDFISGQNSVGGQDAKVQSSTHLFMCDFRSFKNLKSGWVFDPFNLNTGVIKSTKQDGKTFDATSENARIIIEGNIYQILLIDDPMNLHEHLEFILQYVGGGQGV